MVGTAGEPGPIRAVRSHNGFAFKLSRSRDKRASSEFAIASMKSPCRDHRSLRRFSDGVMNGCNFCALFLDGCGEFGGAAEAHQGSGAHNPRAARRVGAPGPATGPNA